MTTAQTGAPEYDGRIRRAERLATQHAFAAEFLNFYRRVAAVQKTLRASIAASNGAKSRGALSAELRDPLDLTVLLPHFRGFLSTIEQHAPAALRNAAHQMALLPSDSWIASLEAYWEHAGNFDQQVGAFAQFLARAFLQPYAEFRAALMPRAPMVVTVRVCPLCGEQAEGKLPVYVAEQLPHIRVEACDTCKFYLQTVDLTKDGHAIPLVDDLAAIPLTLWAQEHGYSRIQPNLLGT